MEKINLQVIAISSMLLFISCSKEDILRGSRNIISENRDVANFTKVYNPSFANIIIIEGSTQLVELSADDNAISSINTIVENGTLKIDLARNNYVDVTITVSVTIPNLEGLRNTGSGDMTVSGFDGLTSMTIDNESSGNISFSGSGISLSLKNSGSGSYKGFGFVTENCSVTNSGSGDCEITCTDTLDGINSGSGNIFYQGNPSVNLTNTGSGQIVDSN